MWKCPGTRGTRSLPDTRQPSVKTEWCFTSRLQAARSRVPRGVHPALEKVKQKELKYHFGIVKVGPKRHGLVQPSKTHRF